MPNEKQIPPQKTAEEKLAALDTLVQKVWQSKSSNLYRDLWSSQPAPINSIEALQKLPSCSWDTLSAYAFQDRLYNNGPGLLTKIVYRDDSPLFVARTFEDIKKETFGVPCERPLLLFSTQHEALEKSIWQYEHNYLPLFANSSPEITAKLATLYEVDCIVCDTAALKAYLPDIALVYDRANIKDVVIIDSDFDLPFLQKQFPDSAIHCVLALPEVGTIGVAQNIEKDEKLVFEIDTHSLVEIGDKNEIVVSRLLDMPTPIIRYHTKISAHWTDADSELFDLKAA